MLRDRQYMRNREENDDGGREGLSCLYGIILLNIFLFIIGNAPSSQFESIFALNVPHFLHGRFWQPLSAMFLHANFLHLFFNMYTLYIFGGFVVQVIGAKKFLWMYLLAGLGGNLLWMLCAITENAVLLGASGAIMGVIAVAAMIAPNIPLHILFIPFPVKMKTLAIVFFLLDVLHEFFNLNGGVAYLAHIGGFITGLIFGAIVLKKQVAWNPFGKLLDLFTSNGSRNYSNYGYKQQDDSTNGWQYHQPEDNVHFSAKGDMYKDIDKPVTQRELDALLDKLSRVGINAMSEYELQRLRKAREQMRNQR